MPPPRRARLRGLAGKLTADVTPLRESRPFRWLFCGQTVSVLGTQVTQVAVQLQVYADTGSSLAVGLVGLFALVPLITFGLYGGAIADAVDRRKLFLITSSGSSLVSTVLMVQALLSSHRVSILYGCVAVQAGFAAIDSPTRRAILPRIVPGGRIAAANSLLMVVLNLGVIGGPVLASQLVTRVGFAAAYAFDVASFLVAIAAVVIGLPQLPPTGEVRRAGWRSVGEGLAFLRGRPVLLMTFVVDIVAMVFGMPRALFPALAAHRFHGHGVGYLYAAPAVGAFLVSLTGGWMTRVTRQGGGVLVAVLGWGAAITAFGFTRELWLALLFLAVAGGADNVSAVFRSTMLQEAAPDRMQGRLSGVFTVVVTGGPRLGDLEAGAVAQAFSLDASIISGGLACVVITVLLAIVVPSFRRYDARQIRAADGTAVG